MTETDSFFAGAAGISVKGAGVLRACRWAAVALLLTVLVGCAGTRPGPGKTRSATAEERIDPMAFFYFSNGTIAFNEGAYQSAAAEFEKALRLDPDSYNIRMELAETYFRLRDLGRAISVASVAQPRDKRVLEFLGRCYRYSGEEGKAFEVYLRLVKQDSTNGSAWWYLSRLALKQGRMTDAAEYMERSARARRDARAFVEAGDIYARNGRLDDALKAFNQSLQYDSSAGNSAAVVAKAEVLQSLHRDAEAAAAYRRAIRLTPEDISLRKRLINSFLYAQQADSAIAAIRQLLDVAPDDPERLRLAILWYETSKTAPAESLLTILATDSGRYAPVYYLGRIAFDRKDYGRAKTLFRRAIAINDSIPDGWLHLAGTLVEQDSLSAAIDLATRAATRVTDPKSLWYFLGVTFSREENYDSALVWLRRVYDLDTTDTRVQFALASTLERSGLFDESVELFSNLIAREPDNAQALNYLGYMFADHNIRLDESLSLIERALALDSTNGAYLDSYGWVLYRLGRLDEAETQIRKALNVIDADAVVQEHLGDILAAKGLREEARKHWRRALELDPKNIALQSKLE